MDASRNTESLGLEPAYYMPVIAIFVASDLEIWRPRGKHTLVMRGPPEEIEVNDLLRVIGASL